MRLTPAFVRLLLALYPLGLFAVPLPVIPRPQGESKGHQKSLEGRKDGAHANPLPPVFTKTYPPLIVHDLTNPHHISSTERTFNIAVPTHPGYAPLGTLPPSSPTFTAHPTSTYAAPESHVPTLPGSTDPKPDMADMLKVAFPLAVVTVAAKIAFSKDQEEERSRTDATEGRNAPESAIPLLSHQSQGNLVGGSRRPDSPSPPQSQRNSLDSVHSTAPPPYSRSPPPNLLEEHHRSPSPQHSLL